MNTRKADGFENLKRMRSIPDIESHDMIKEAGDEFSGATTGRNNRSTWVVRLADFGKESACRVCEVRWK